uniref:Glycosyltransferase n=1 Tax=Epimedium pseudowushanense TaxID=589473 RepID=A0A5P1KKD8_9MAGN|nr:glycosyltransferase [Epimedium pseudowushanense]
MGSETHQLHALFFPFMAHGHMIPMIDIARIFSVRGLKSTIITTPQHATNITSKICRYQNSGLDIKIITIPFPSEEFGLPKGCESVDSIPSRDMLFNFFDAVAKLQLEFERILEEIHPDCIVSDMFLPWTNDVACKHGTPRIIFHGTSFFSLCVANVTREYSVYESEGETFLLPGLPDEIKMKKSMLPSHLGSKDRFGEMMDRIRDTEVTSYGVLVNSFYELEPAYADHYRNVLGRRAWHIGPVSLSNNNIIDKAQRGKKAGIDEHYCLNWLNSKEKDSVIYVSFGSVSRFSCVQLTEIAHGLEASAVSFIWVVRQLKDEEDNFLPEGFEERIHGRGLVIKDWAPQVLILDHPAIGGFVTHCGWNSILEGVSAGVPMITWPLFAEQFYNEALITQVMNIGMKVGVERWSDWTEQGHVLVTKETVKKVVNQLMATEEGEEIRNRARMLKGLARKAVKEDGSSFTDLTRLIEELHHAATIGH